MKLSMLDSNNIILEELGKRLKKARIEMRITQNELAKQSGISLRTISNIENGSDFSIDSLLRILKVLHLEQGINNIVPENEKYYVKEDIKPKQRYRKAKQTGTWKWGE